jgi:hypothetical protein
MFRIFPSFFLLLSIEMGYSQPTIFQALPEDSSQINQSKTLDDFWSKMCLAHELVEFTSEDKAFPLRLKKRKTGRKSGRVLDSSSVSEFRIYEFTSHPALQPLNIKGRMEKFIAASADGSRLYDANMKLFLEFDNELDARNCMNLLYDCLSKISEEQINLQTNKGELHQFGTEEYSDRHVSSMVLLKRPSKRGKGCEIFVDSNLPPDLATDFPQVYNPESKQAVAKTKAK